MIPLPAMMRISPRDDICHPESDRYHPHFNVIIKEMQDLVKDKDNGIGVSGEDQQRLFERFYRGSNIGNIQGAGWGCISC